MISASEPRLSAITKGSGWPSHHVMCAYFEPRLSKERFRSQLSRDYLALLSLGSRVSALMTSHDFHVTITLFCLSQGCRWDFHCASQNYPTGLALRISGLPTGVCVSCSIPRPIHLHGASPGVSKQAIGCSPGISEPSMGFESLGIAPPTRGFHTSCHTATGSIDGAFHRQFNATVEMPYYVWSWSHHALQGSPVRTPRPFS